MKALFRLLLFTCVHVYSVIDHEIICTAILLLSDDSRRVVVSCKRKYVHKVLVNCLVKLAQEKVWLGELTVLTCMTIAFDGDVNHVKNQTEQTKMFTLCIKRLFVKKSCKFSD